MSRAGGCCSARGTAPAGRLLQESRLHDEFQEIPRVLRPLGRTAELGRPPESGAPRSGTSPVGTRNRRGNGEGGTPAQGSPGGPCPAAAVLGRSRPRWAFPARDTPVPCDPVPSPAAVTELLSLPHARTASFVRFSSTVFLFGWLVGFWGGGGLFFCLVCLVGFLGVFFVNFLFSRSLTPPRRCSALSSPSRPALPPLPQRAAGARAFTGARAAPGRAEERSRRREPALGARSAARVLEREAEGSTLLAPGRRQLG